MEKKWTRPPALILGIDIGTTYSGVSFLYLTEGENPSGKIQRVASWPGENVKPEAKVPTLVWYDQNRKAVKLGVEAYKLKRKKAEADGLKLAKHFKHHLHPPTMAATLELDKPELPYGVDLEQVYVDFMTYLLDNTKNFFAQKVLGGKRIWESFSSSRQVVLAHPNGWGTPEQGFLRKAARRAGMVSQNSQIYFVTEAEASVHFCLTRPTLNLASSIQIGDNIIVCDAGGSTVDITLYKITKKTPPLQLEEVKASACIQAGGIVVDSNAGSFLEGRFNRVDGLSLAQQARYIENGIDDFISNAKTHFDNSEDEILVKVGGVTEDFDDIEVDSGDMIIPP